MKKRLGSSKWLATCFQVDIYMLWVFDKGGGREGEGGGELVR